MKKREINRVSETNGRLNDWLSTPFRFPNQAKQSKAKRNKTRETLCVNDKSIQSSQLVCLSVCLSIHRWGTSSPTHPPTNPPNSLPQPLPLITHPLKTFLSLSHLHTHTRIYTYIQGHRHKHRHRRTKCQNK